MSISHTLDIQTELSAKEIENLLLLSDLGLKFTEGIEFTVDDDTEFNNSGLDGLGISITPRKASNLAKEITLEDNGFIPDVSIGFELKRYESETAGDITAEKACAILLAQGTGNAVYFYNLNHLVFKRINGKLILYDDWADSLIPELDKLGVKYELEKSEYAKEFS
jgi:hypothetical protein